MKFVIDDEKSEEVKVKVSLEKGAEGEVKVIVDNAQCGRNNGHLLLTLNRGKVCLCRNTEDFDGIESSNSGHPKVELQ